VVVDEAVRPAQRHVGAEGGGGAAGPDGRERPRRARVTGERRGGAPVRERAGGPRDGNRPGVRATEWRARACGGHALGDMHLGCTHGGDRR